MNKEQILSRLAPSELYCGKCFVFSDGDISKQSAQLHNKLGDSKIYAERFVELINEPVFIKYNEF